MHDEYIVVLLFTLFGNKHMMEEVSHTHRGSTFFYFQVYIGGVELNGQY